MCDQSLRRISVSNGDKKYVNADVSDEAKEVIIRGEWIILVSCLRGTLVFSCGRGLREHCSKLALLLLKQ